MDVIAVHDFTQEVWAVNTGNDWTATITQPWGGAKPVYVHCSLNYASGGGETEIGIAESYYLDAQGNFQTASYGDPTYGSHPATLYQPRLLAITVIFRTYDAILRGNAIMWLWG